MTYLPERKYFYIVWMLRRHFTHDKCLLWMYILLYAAELISRVFPDFSTFVSLATHDVPTTSLLDMFYLHRELHWLHDTYSLNSEVNRKYSKLNKDFSQGSNKNASLKIKCDIIMTITKKKSNGFWIIVCLCTWCLRASKISCSINTENESHDLWLDYVTETLWGVGSVICPCFVPGPSTAL